MPAEIVTVSVQGGRAWTAWESVRIKASFKEAARSFELKAAAEGGARQVADVFALFSPVVIKAGADLLVTGYVEKRRPSHSATSAEIAISGRSKGADAIDCSATHATGEFRNQTPLQIAQALDSYGVGFTSDIALDPVDFRATPGATVFRSVEPLARAQGATLTGDPDGTIRITNASGRKRKHAGGLIWGKNIKTGSADHDATGRHSQYRVVGQKGKTTGADALRLEAIARDAGVPRDRVVVVVHDDDADKARLKKRARNRRNRSAGKGLTCEITVPGWRDEKGRLWTPGWLVWTQDSFLGVCQDMLIEDVSFVQDSGGTIAELSLVDPRAHQGKAGKGDKSKNGWSTPDSEAEEGGEA